MMSTITKAECVSRIKEIKTKLNQIHDEQKLLTVDLSALQQQWQAVLHENMPIKPTERPAYLQSTTGATGPTVATQSNSNSCRGKELNKEEICGNCNTPGHTLENCIKQELDGFVHGCPRCNTREHNFDKCTYTGHKDLYFLVQLRNGLPPIVRKKTIAIYPASTAQTTVHGPLSFPKSISTAIGTMNTKVGDQREWTFPIQRGYRKIEFPKVLFPTLRRVVMPCT